MEGTFVNICNIILVMLIERKVIFLVVANHCYTSKLDYVKHPWLPQL